MRVTRKASTAAPGDATRTAKGSPAVRPPAAAPKARRAATPGICQIMSLKSAGIALLGYLAALSVAYLPGLPGVHIHPVTMVLMGIVAAGIGGVGGYLALFGIRRRIHQVSGLLAEAEAGNYAARIKVLYRDELGLLAERANGVSENAEQRERQMTTSAMTDSLTGLPNRALLSNRLDQMIAKAKRDAGQFAVAVIDLDRFKWVNDTLGHGAGDTLLREVALLQ